MLFRSTLLAYVAFVRNAGTMRYVVVAAVFILGLMSKPMLVTLPFVLLLVDIWPLGRKEGLKRLVVEKLPLIAIAVLFSAIALAVQSRTGTVGNLTEFPLAVRVSNIPVSYVVYLAKTVWPSDLSAFYPMAGPATWLVMLSITVLIGTTAAVFLVRQKRPYLLVGWMWYLLTLLPVIGLIQIGSQARADRYTYIPLIGIFVAGAWEASDFLKRWQNKRLVAATLAGEIGRAHV